MSADAARAALVLDGWPRAVLFRARARSKRVIEMSQAPYPLLNPLPKGEEVKAGSAFIGLERGEPRTLSSILSPARGLPLVAGGRGCSGKHFVLVFGFLNQYQYHYWFDPQEGSCTDHGRTESVAGFHQRT